MSSPTSPLPRLPIVGRSHERAQLGTALDEAADGRGGTVILAGAGGIGKSRLAELASDDAERRGWTVARGRAYPVEAGIPYAVFSDALLPILRSLDPAALTVLTRGGEAELVHLLPALAPAVERAIPQPDGDPAEFRIRLLWNFTRFLRRFAAQQPLLLIVEDLQWADASSLELLHFVARQITDDPILLLCTYNETAREQNHVLRETERSLLSLEAARLVRLPPLTRMDTETLVHGVFGVEAAVTENFVDLLYGWTRGNPFFIDETLKGLVASGRLYRQDGVWLGWEVDELELPRTLREAVLARVDRLTPAARTVADLAAVIGTRASYDALRALSALPETELVGALDELRSSQVLAEAFDGEGVAFDFEQPILRETLYAEFGRARARLLHGKVAGALEEFYGAAAVRHAGELAYHFSRADARGVAGKAITYLSAAGRSALAKYANGEAAAYLRRALDLTDRDLAPETPLPDPALVTDLARALQRTGEYDEAIALWERACAMVPPDDPSRRAALGRRIGLAHFRSGRHLEALQHYDAALAEAEPAGGGAPRVRLRLARGVCLQELGRHAEAKEEVEAALADAKAKGEPALLARVHRALLLLYTWTGPPDVAREHGARAIALAEEAGVESVACDAHWALAVLEGLTGNTAAVTAHLAVCDRLAESLDSPLVRLWAAEVSIEFASASGDWEAGLALGERSIALARTLNQKTLLPRLLVWTALIYFGRGDLERGKRYTDEAWTLSGAAAARDGHVDVHTVVPAHIGRAAYHLAAEEYEHAIRVGEAGIELADRTGYVVWAIHRLLPIVAESCLWQRDLDRAERIGWRLRRDSERLGHKLGLAWGDACDALVLWLRGDGPGAVGLLRNAAEELEAIPLIWDAARIRRQLGGRLLDLGDRDGAAREVLRAHEVFARLGAERELRKARDQLRDEIGVRPPPATVRRGAGALTTREVEIARLVAERKSNKAIAKALGISARTVSTHLSNMFRKLELSSRGELVDLVRQRGLPTM